MKKNLTTIALLALIAGACTNPLDYQAGQPESIIIMNASLRTDETVHTVWLCQGGITELSGINDAELTCYINDEFAAKAHLALTEDEKDYQDDYGYYYFARPYEFSAEIKPGDKVRLDASWYGLHASATTYAPNQERLLRDQQGGSAPRMLDIGRHELPEKAALRLRSLRGRLPRKPL